VLSTAKIEKGFRFDRSTNKSVFHRSPAIYGC